MGGSPHSVHFDAVKTAFTSTLLAALTWTQALAANVDEELAKFSQRFQAAQIRQYDRAFRNLRFLQSEKKPVVDIEK